MKNITEIASESYIEDLRSYDNPEYVITYSEYDWRMSYIAYESMLNELTHYHDLNQPDTDYETFGLESNSDVIYLVKSFFKFHDLFLISENDYNDTKNKKGFVKVKNNIFYLLIDKWINRLIV